MFSWGGERRRRIVHPARGKVVSGGGGGGLGARGGRWKGGWFGWLGTCGGCCVGASPMRRVACCVLVMVLLWSLSWYWVGIPDGVGDDRSIPRRSVHGGSRSGINHAWTGPSSASGRSEDAEARLEMYKRLELAQEAIMDMAVSADMMKGLGDGALEDHHVTPPWLWLFSDKEHFLPAGSASSILLAILSNSPQAIADTLGATDIRRIKAMVADDARKEEQKEEKDLVLPAAYMLGVCRLLRLSAELAQFPVDDRPTLERHLPNPVLAARKHEEGMRWALGRVKEELATLNPLTSNQNLAVLAMTLSGVRCTSSILKALPTWILPSDTQPPTPTPSREQLEEYESWGQMESRLRWVVGVELTEASEGGWDDASGEMKKNVLPGGVSNAVDAAAAMCFIPSHSLEKEALQREAEVNQVMQGGAVWGEKEGEDVVEGERGHEVMKHALPGKLLHRVAGVVSKALTWAHRSPAGFSRPIPSSSSPQKPSTVLPSLRSLLHLPQIPSTPAPPPADEFEKAARPVPLLVLPVEQALVHCGMERMRRRDATWVAAAFDFVMRRLRKHRGSVSGFAGKGGGGGERGDGFCPPAYLLVPARSRDPSQTESFDVPLTLWKRKGKKKESMGRILRVSLEEGNMTEPFPTTSSHGSRMLMEETPWTMRAQERLSSVGAWPSGGVRVNGNDGAWFRPEESMEEGRERPRVVAVDDVGEVADEIMEQNFASALVHVPQDAIVGQASAECVVTQAYFAAVEREQSRVPHSPFVVPLAHESWDIEESSMLIHAVSKLLDTHKSMATTTEELPNATPQTSPPPFHEAVAKAKEEEEMAIAEQDGGNEEVVEAWVETERWRAVCQEDGSVFGGASVVDAERIGSDWVSKASKAAAVCCNAATSLPAAKVGVGLRGFTKQKSAWDVPISVAAFTCDGGSVKLPCSALNDDVCDCNDGTDEPGTSACPNSYFYCPSGAMKPYTEEMLRTPHHHHHKPLRLPHAHPAGPPLLVEKGLIPSSRVGDAICDCVHGNDETVSGGDSHPRKHCLPANAKAPRHEAPGVNKVVKNLWDPKTFVHAGGGV